MFKCTTMGGIASHYCCPQQQVSNPCCVAIAAMALERNIQVLKHEVGIENEKPLPKAM